MAKDEAKLDIREIALFAVLGALTFGAKFVMSYLPNIEPVSLFVMVYAVVLGKKSLYPIYIYVVLEFLFYGIHLWAVCYLYVWLILALGAMALRKMESPVGWAVLSGSFGLLFGALCAPVDLVTGGWGLMVSKWISGIPFDLLHCVGNFVVALVLFRPVRRLVESLYRTMAGDAR